MIKTQQSSEEDLDTFCINGFPVSQMGIGVEVYLDI